MSDARHTLPDVRARLLQRGVPRSPALRRGRSSCSSRRSRAGSRAETVESTKRILAIVIAFGGQWPHSTYMMPGGVTCALDEARLARCPPRSTPTPTWYERVGARLHLRGVARARDGRRLRAWLEVPAHRESAVGVFTRFGRSIGLQQLGAGHAAPAERRAATTTPSAGSPPFERAAVPAARRLLRRRARTRSSRSRTAGRRAPALRQVRRSRRRRHPWDSQTRPGRRARRGRTATPRRPATSDHVVQLGPLADLVLAGDPLIRSLFDAEGPTTWLRQFTRLHRPVATLRGDAPDACASCARISTSRPSSAPNPRPTATASERSTPRAAAWATGSRSGTARSPTTRSSRRPPGTARRATTPAGAGTGRRASSAWRSRTSTTRSSSSTSCARTTPASSARCTSRRGRGAPELHVRVAAACVVCFGNPWHGDDGFGLHVFRRLRDARAAAGRRALRCRHRGPERAAAASRAAPRR